MRLIVWAVLALAALAEGEGGTATKVVIGTPAEVRVGGPISMGKCDDTSVVRIETSEGSVRLVGLKEGKTTCGFWVAGMGTHAVLEVTVVTEDEDAKSSGRREK